jgi:hypothetical protein
MSTVNLFGVLANDEPAEEWRGVEELIERLNLELITEVVGISERDPLDVAEWRSISVLSLYRQAQLLHRISLKLTKSDTKQLHQVVSHQKRLLDTFRCSALLSLFERLLRRVAPCAQFHDSAVECCRAFASLFLQTEILIVDFNNRCERSTCGDGAHSEKRV